MTVADEQNWAGIDLAVDWAPAYELLMSFHAFVSFRLHSLLDLGQAWVRDTRERLPAELAARLSHKSLAASLKEHADLVVLLVRVCPAARDARGFLDWFAGLTPGAAYEALVQHLPEPGPRLPRDFGGWRDHYLELLSGWETAYFRHLDPAILDGLSASAATLRARLGSAPASVLVEDVTNGILVEPSPNLRGVTLVPQYHQRPYNTDAAEQGGVIILYPADVLPTPPDLPPTGLVRLTHALSDESRLRILRFLADGPCTLTEVARLAGLSQPTVHHHLVQLRAAGLVRVHFVVPGPSRYSLRPHALDQLSQQLGAYLTSPSSQPSTSSRKESHP
jgi:DNA-binding transcriptional ArsR family regulator